MLTMNEGTKSHRIKSAIEVIKYLANYDKEMDAIRETAKSIIERIQKMPRGNLPNMPTVSNAARWSSKYYMVNIKPKESIPTNEYSIAC